MESDGEAISLQGRLMSGSRERIDLSAAHLLP
jgi:hypothetical protein